MLSKVELDINAIKDALLSVDRYALLIVFHINAQSIDFLRPDFCIISSYFVINLLSFYEHSKHKRLYSTRNQ